MDDEVVARMGRSAEGEVSTGMKTAVVGAAVLTAMMVMVLLAVVDRQFADAYETAHPQLAGDVGRGLAFWSIVVFVAITAVRGVTWWVRTAVGLALVHLGMLVAVGFAWWSFDDPYVQVPLVRGAPVHLIALALGGALIVAALVRVGRRGVPGWLQGAAVFALVHLVVLGAWLPAVVGAAGLDDPSQLAAARLAWRLLPVIVAVPLIAAALVTWWVLAARRQARRPGANLTFVGSSLLGLGYLVAIAAAPRAFTGRLLLSNVAHVLIGAVVLAWCALVALAIGHLRALRAVRHDRRRAAPWVQEGVVVGERGDDVVARLGFVGWLGGFAVAARGFRLRTRAADLPVPAGARVLAHLGGWSIGAAPGDSLPVVRAGDRVQVSGFVAPPAAGPFREGLVPVAGSSGLVLGVGDQATPPAGSELVLALWRPCLLFLGGSVLAALPVLVGS